MVQSREATPNEMLLWQRFTNELDTQIKPANYQLMSAAQLARSAQFWVDQNRPGIAFFNYEDWNQAEACFRQYELLQRVRVGVESGKYFIRVRQDGDLDIVAPPGMKKEQYEADRWTAIPVEREVDGLGLHPVVWAIIAGGAVIVSGIMAVGFYNRSQAVKIKAETARAVVDIDREMAKASKEVREAWSKYKEQNKQLADKAESSLLDDIFGAGTGKKIVGALGIGALVLGGLFVFSQLQKKNASPAQ